jgi:hypothetical protein
MIKRVVGFAMMEDVLLLMSPCTTAQRDIIYIYMELESQKK